MKYGFYSIRDKLVGFMTPALDASDASATRNFARAINQENTMFDFAPDDYDLYLVGYFDDHTGSVEPVEPVKFIASGASLVGVKYEK